MPDLNDELRALLHDRAEDAPAVPAPTDRLVRTVRRRQALRTSLAAAGAVTAVVALVAVAGSVGRDRDVASPAAPAKVTPTPAPASDKYEFCTGPVSPDVVVSVHATELKFQYGCYRVKAGTAGVTFSNPQPVGHNLVIAPEDGSPLFKTDVITARPGEVATVTADLVEPLRAGDYTLTCMVHPSMHAQLVVR
jgi:plastocyanin